LKVTKAVIPAAGLGTRFLPASKALPKEMIPVVDKPGIQYAVEECVRAGIEDIIVVTSRGKGSLEDHFDRAPDLERQLGAKGKTSELEAVVEVTELASMHYVRQMEPLGFGHAVLMAKDHIGDDPFVVLVPDEIVPSPIGDEVPLLERMIEASGAHGASVIAVKEVPHQDVSSYGVIDSELVSGDLHRINDIVEKPPIDEAPSDLAARGRYVFTPGLFEAIERTEPGAGGEIQLTDAIRLRVTEEGAFAYVHTGPIYDVGKKLDYLQASVELALRRDDLAEPFQAFLAEVVSRNS
jgi:UTP--glucose-1-phosphate uridylyltransferase